MARRFTFPVTVALSFPRSPNAPRTADTVAPPDPNRMAVELDMLTDQVDVVAPHGALADPDPLAVARLNVCVTEIETVPGALMSHRRVPVIVAMPAFVADPFLSIVKAVIVGVGVGGGR